MTNSIVVRHLTHLPIRQGLTQLSRCVRPPTQTERALRNEFIRRNIQEFGPKAALLLPYYEVVNTTRHLRKKVLKSGPAPNVTSSLLPREWTATVILGFIGLTLMGNARGVEAAQSVAPVSVASSSLPTPAVKSVPEVAGDVESRLELGRYAQPEYPYPHLRIELGRAEPQFTTFSAFNGKKVGRGMYSRYLGIEGEIPQAAVVNVDQQRARMFELKLANNPDTTPVARGMQVQYTQMYGVQRTHMTLAQFVDGVDRVNRESIASIDFASLCSDHRVKLGEKECSLLQRLVGQTTGVQQVAYAFTELLPKDKKHKGAFNAWVFEHGLINYGRESWDLTPAGGDKYASAGPWQFTSMAVGAYIDEEGNPQIGPVTFISRHAGLKVPESFLDFKRTDHERAALYFRVANLTLLTRDAAKEKKAYAALERVAQGGHEVDMLAFVATSHHAQNKVRKSFAMPWLRDGAKKPYTKYLRGRFKEYGARTLINYPGLVRYLSNPQAAAASFKEVRS